MEVDLPHPNPGLAAMLLSQHLRAILEERANTAAMLFQSQVARVTNQLAASAHPSTEIGGMEHDRWIGVLEVGGPGPLGTPDYAASHQFGHYVRDDGEIVGYAHPSHDLNRVLELIGYV